MKTSRHFGRLMSPGRRPMRPLAAHVIEELPLGNPVGAHAGTVRFQLPVQVIEFPFQHFGTLVELKLGKAFRQDRLHLVERMGLEQVQHHGIADDELAVDGLGLAREALRNDAEVDVR